MALTKVTSNVLNDNAVTTTKIVDLNVTTPKIAGDAITSVKLADDAVATAKLADDAVATAKLADDSVTSAKAGNEFTTAAALTMASPVALDYTSAQVFTLTPNANMTINITNPVIGVTKVIVITGGGATSTLTFNVGGAAGTFNKISGDYDDTTAKKNFIQITCVSSTEFWYSISQIA